jgi:hypothetical protein
MQMGAARGAGSPDTAESLAECHGAAAAGQGGGEAAEMGVAGAAAVGVEQFHGEAGRAHAPKRGHPARGGGTDPGTGGGGQVHPLVHRGAARAEGGGDAGRPLQRHQQGSDEEEGVQLLVAGWKVPMELPPSQLTTAPVM